MLRCQYCLFQSKFLKFVHLYILRLDKLTKTIFWAQFNQKFAQIPAGTLLVADNDRIAKKCDLSDFKESITGPRKVLGLIMLYRRIF